MIIGHGLKSYINISDVHGRIFGDRWVFGGWGREEKLYRLCSGFGRSGRLFLSRLCGRGGIRRLLLRFLLFLMTL